MTTLYFVRHGQTDWNLSGLFQGQTDIPLNDTGRAQARQTALLLQDAPIDVILASPLCRAVQTAQEIRDALGLAVPILPTEGLKERYFGTLEGVSIDRVDADALWIPASPENRLGMGGIEPLCRLCARVNACLNQILIAYAGKSVLMVAHGGVAVPIRARFEGAPGDGHYRALIPDNGHLLRYTVPGPLSSPA